jgi:hypothetical protein
MDRAMWIDRSTGEVHEVKNLGWLLRHASDVEFISIVRRADSSRWDCDLHVHLTDNREYRTPFASFEICKRWIDRPCLRGIPCTITE